MDFQTPKDVCNYMFQYVYEKDLRILEPTPGEGNLVSVLRQNNNAVVAPNNFFDIDKTIERFDYVVMNPPFTPMKIGYQILFDCMEMSDNIIALMPWLTIINAKGRTDKILEYGLKSITHLPRTIFKGSRVQTCILEMRKGFVGDAMIKFYKEEK